MKQKKGHMEKGNVMLMILEVFFHESKFSAKKISCGKTWLRRLFEQESYFQTKFLNFIKSLEKNQNFQLSRQEFYQAST
jgi:hypothetical protein